MFRLIGWGSAYASRATYLLRLLKDKMAQKFNVGDLVDVVIPGMEPRTGLLIEEVQGYSAEGLIFSADYPIVIGWQYIIEGLAYDERFLQNSGA